MNDNENPGVLGKVVSTILLLAVIATLAVSNPSKGKYIEWYAARHPGPLASFDAAAQEENRAWFESRTTAYNVGLFTVFVTKSEETKFLPNTTLGIAWMLVPIGNSK